ncbi:hypothetical protein CWE14_04940 [Aliidiomarina soli]|uniref:Uncharacterized protein n=1 Tax=Aliidiomarina soli TaxID=1928574 RepID=A0A432WJ03_9GAMM|nr:hypothetical protein CWE14_04940 [Aliidiomarina soli]
MSAGKQNFKWPDADQQSFKGSRRFVRNKLTFITIERGEKWCGAEIAVTVRILRKVIRSTTFECELGLN